MNLTETIIKSTKPDKVTEQIISEALEEKKKKPEPKTYYIWITTDEKGEVKAVKTETATPTSEEIEKAEVVATGLEAEAMARKAYGQVMGYSRHHHYTTNQLQKVKEEVKQLGQQRQQLEEEIRKAEEWAKRLDRTNPTEVARYNAFIDILMKQIEQYNEKAYTTTLKYAEIAGGLEGQQYRRIQEYDPMKEQIEAVKTIYQRGPLYGIGFNVATGILSWSDPLGLRSTIEGIIGWYEGGREEQVSRMLKVKAEALTELQQRFGTTPQELQPLEVINVPITTPVTAYLIGAGTGGIMRVASSIGRPAEALTATGLSALGGYLIYETGVKHIQKGDVSRGLANLTVLALSAPMAIRGFKVGYREAGEVLRVSKRVFDYVNPLKRSFYKELPMEEELFQMAHLRMQKALRNQAVSELLTGEKQELPIFKAERELRKVQLLATRYKIEGKIRGTLERLRLKLLQKLEYSKRLPEGEELYTEDYVSGLIEAIEHTRYYSGFSPTRTITVEVLREKAPRIPRDLDIYSYIEDVGRPRRYTPSPLEVTGYDKVAWYTKNVEAPRFFPIPLKETRVVQSRAYRYMQLLKTKALNRLNNKLYKAELIKQSEETRETYREGQREMHKLRTRFRTYTQTITLTLESSKLKEAMKEAIKELNLRGLKYEVPELREITVLPFFRLKMRAPRLKIMTPKRMPKLRWKPERFVKGILADLLSVAKSQLLYGRATHPKPTKTVWRMARKTFFIRLPTRELMSPSKTKRRKRRKR